jgi:hypothetical protein
MASVTSPAMMEAQKITAAALETKGEARVAALVAARNAQDCMAYFEDADYRAAAAQHAQDVLAETEAVVKAEAGVPRRGVPMRRVVVG